MALPSIVAPHFTTKLPSNGVDIKFRPFLVKEEKLLLIAAESGERKDMIDAICQMLFLHIRSKSVGETAQFKLKHDVENCGHMNDVEVKLDNIVHVRDEKHTDTFLLNDNIGVKMKYPDINSLSIFMDIKPDNILDVFSNGIEYVYDQDTVYDDFTKEDVSDFLESLSKDQFDKITNFYQTMPTSRLMMKYKCEGCGEEVETNITGFEDFFG
jgi:hypothetical protein